ncbi:putative 1-alkyl-2-acetylglycerophosphocholine esterase [Lachnellula occidentalis]|uniref:1-alkyl-2-acetylglycerophosphocholine esterase n=1 Tax=Lachnellula occidentalis TaxID=215460 RepID=A0A8H8S557_9HELO|nr:putative 1-alkyl-2-acetylglycerophosphocholine esterase [Lachnellula occidentalis]
MHLLLLLAFASQALSLNLTLPNPIGPSLVGRTSIELLDTSRLDPLAPDVRYRDLMLSIFYPIQHTRRYHLAPAFVPAYATYLETSLGLSSNITLTVTSAAYANAYLHPNSNSTSTSQPNILLFSPGHGNSYQDYTATLTNLASQGYIVVGVDHPFDTSFILYPDNRTAIATNSSTDTAAGAARTVDIRVADLRAVLDFLGTNATFAKQIPGVHGTLDVSSVGVFGHSLGGAASASAMATDARFACGSNLDGTFWGSVVGTGVERPFFLMSSAVHNQSNDDSWKWFWGNSTGEKLEVGIEGSVHATFTDFAVLYDDVVAAGGSVPGVAGTLGTIQGARMLEVVGEFAGAWFDGCLQGKREVVLDGPSEAWPEVEFWDLGRMNEGLIETPN